MFNLESTSTLMRLTITQTRIILDPDYNTTSIQSKLVIDRSSMKVVEAKDPCSGISPKKIYGLLGLLEVNGRPVLIYIDKAEEIGMIEGWAIYRIIKVGFIDKVLVSIKQKNQEFDNDLQEKDCLEKVKTLFNSTFFFSYGIDLTNQKQFQWNSYLCKSFPTEWQLKVIQGYVGIVQTTLKSLKSIKYCIISRRSIFKGGSIRNDTGVDNNGNVANFTETEQIIYVDNEKASQVFCRGSIPLFWSYNVLNNSIVISKDDPKRGLGKHCNMLLANYNKLHFLTLVDDGSQLSVYLDKYLQESENLSFYKINFKEAFLQHDFIAINNFLERFYSIMDFTSSKQKQQNLIRINCYDCLEQTNIVMSKLAIMGVQKMLLSLKIDLGKEFDSTSLYVDFDQPSINNMHPLLLYVKQKWNENGDHIRQAYKVGQQDCDLNQFYKNLLEEKQLQDIINKVLGFAMSETQAHENIEMLEKTMKRRENEYIRLLDKLVYTVTWNINAHTPSDEEVYKQLFIFTQPPHIVAIGFQELVTLNTLTVVGRQNREVVEKWKQIIFNCLNTRAKYVLAAQQVMVGTFLLVFVLDEEKNHISNVKTEIVKYGFGQQLGNKGGVVIYCNTQIAKLRFYDSNICFINVHLPAGQKNNDDRIAAFDYIHNKAELAQCDWVITFGDMNFRVNLPQQQVVANIQKFQNIQFQEQKEAILKHLKENDQLHLEKQKSTFLRKFQEGDIQFLPTYKFDIGTEIYDTIKKRVPSFTDRILLRKIQKIQTHQPLWYNSIRGNFQMSDHRPVGCSISTQVCKVDQEKKEQLFRELIHIDEEQGLKYFPKVEVVKHFDTCIKRQRADRQRRLNNRLEDLIKLCDPDNE